MNDKKKYEAEFNFKDIAINPLKIFGIVFPLFLILVIVLGVFYVKNINAISQNSQEVKYPAVDLSIKPIELKQGGFKPAVDLNTVAFSNEDLIAKGKKLYTSTCASCHGDNGDGNGIAGVNLNPKPRDFSSKENWTNGYSIDGLFKTLQVGILKNGMAAYEYLPVEDRFAILHYVRSFGDFYGKIKQEDIDNLDKQYNLTSDVYVPHQVPVDKAISGILRDADLEKEAEVITGKLNQFKDENGFTVLASLTDNPIKFISVYKKLGEQTNLKELLYSNHKALEMKSEVLYLTNEDFKNLTEFIKKF